MRDSLKVSNTKIENKLAFPVTILVGVSLLCVAFLVSRDTTYLKMVSNEITANENVLLLSFVCQDSFYILGIFAFVFCIFCI